MSEQELWDKFYEIAWSAVEHSDYNDEECKSDCPIENLIYEVIFFGDLFEERAEWPEGNGPSTYASMYHNKRTMQEADWLFFTTSPSHMRVFEELARVYPEYEAIRILYV